MGTDVILLGGGGGNPAMHWPAVQRGEAKLQGMLHAKETGLSSGHFGLWPRVRLYLYLLSV